MIRNVTIEDAEQICRIYNYYVENTIITFEEKPVSVEEMKSRIQKITQINSFPWYVYDEGNKIIGYSYASKWKERYAYRFTAESTVYIDNNHKKKGIGTQLYKMLLDCLKQQKYHSVIGVLAIPNENSKALHQKFGFEQTAHFKEVGYKFDKWIDVAYWQLFFK